jgi:anti-sigma B factor antagonist
VHLAVRGELDLAAAPTLREHLYAAVDRSSGPLIVDLLAVTFIDSTALGVLIGTQERSEGRGIDLRLVIEDARIIKIFEITGLTELFSISATVGEAAVR